MSNFQCPFCRLKTGHHRQCQYSINWESKAKRDIEIQSLKQQRLKNTQVVAAWSIQANSKIQTSK